jgi:hypothetical protein
MSGKYYPNNWEAIQDAPDELFDVCTWEEFFEWKVCAWEIPASVSCILRAEHKKTGKVTEHVYQQPKAAHKRLLRYMEDGDYEVTVCNADSIHLVKRAYYDESDHD